MKKYYKLKVFFAGMVMAFGAGSALAKDSFDGVTVEVKLIGGQQYEGLYGNIAKWEAKTGAKVKIVSKKRGIIYLIA